MGEMPARISNLDRQGVVKDIEQIQARLDLLEFRTIPHLTTCSAQSSTSRMDITGNCSPICEVDKGPRLVRSSMI